MKTLWFFVILAAVNGEVCPPISGTDDQGNPTTTPSNKWGEACDKTCGKCSDDQGCDKKTGHCISNECDEGWSGDKCDKCAVGWSGNECNECAEGWAGDKCNECAAGWWGEAEGDTQECSKTCGECSDKTKGCDKTFGHCISKKCAEGWSGDKCTTAMWGEDPEFSKPCGKCSDDQPCDKKTGQCISNECAEGWWGEPEENGQCWKPCGKCIDDEGNVEGCDKKTGHCKKCDVGWQGDKCTTAMCRTDQCGWYGECVAPNQCRCPRKYTRVIKWHETGHMSGEVKEVSCTNQSIDGFVNGFIPTIAILIFVIIAFNALTGVPKMCVEKED